MKRLRPYAIANVLIVLWFMIFWLIGDARATTRPSWIRADHYQTFLCESAGNWKHEVHRSDGSYGGGFSWFVGTWRLDKFRGMPSVPWRASPRAQYKVFLRSIARGRYFGCRA